MLRHQPALAIHLPRRDLVSLPIVITLCATGLIAVLGLGLIWAAVRLNQQKDK